jgi:CBS domain-containing protein
MQLLPRRPPGKARNRPADMRNNPRRRSVDEIEQFRRRTMQVQQIMSHDVHLADPNMTIRDAARAMRADNIGSLPVGENDRLIGMVTDRDIAMRAVAEGRAPGTTTVREVMSEGIRYCFDDDDAKDAAKLMAKHQIRRLPVINHDKRLVGVLALADLGRSDGGSAQGALKGISEPTD